MLPSFCTTTTKGEAQLVFDLRRTPAANGLSTYICSFTLMAGLRRHGRCLIGRVPGFNSIRGEEVPCSDPYRFCRARTYVRIAL